MIDLTFLVGEGLENFLMHHTMSCKASLTFVCHYVKLSRCTRQMGDANTETRLSLASAPGSQVDKYYDKVNTLYQHLQSIKRTSMADINTSKPYRLTSLAMFNKSLTSLRPKGFSRNRQPSGNNEASQSTMSLLGSNRDSFNPTAPPSTPLTLSHAQPSMKHPIAAPASLVRSSTTSYLPVPVKPATTSPDKALVQSRTTSLFRSRIPTPPSRQPNYLHRSTTQPNLPMAVVPRKASELPRPHPQKRFGVSQWSFAEEVRPLLQPTGQNRETRTPSASSSSSEGESRQQLSIPRRVDSLPQAKENTHHVIQCHSLLQPVQPLSLKNLPLVEVSGPPPLPEFFNTPGSTPPLEIRRQSPQIPTPEPPTDPKQVHISMPTGYWAGRFCSLNDHLMNDTESKSSGQFSPHSFTSCSSDSSSRRPDGFKRPVAPPGSMGQVLHVLRTLESVCTTEQAKRSLLIFRNMYALNHDMPRLKVEVPKQSPVAVFKNESEEGSRKVSDSSTTSIGRGSRKFTFMERLRGRKSSGRS